MKSDSEVRSDSEYPESVWQLVWDFFCLPLIWMRARRAPVPWTETFFDDGPCWYHPEYGSVHLIERPDGWRCRIFDAQSNDPPDQYCPPDAHPDTAVAIAGMWLRSQNTPQSDADGRPFVCIQDGKIVADTSPTSECTILYLDDSDNVEELFDSTDIRPSVRWLQRSINDWRREVQ